MSPSPEKVDKEGEVPANCNTTHETSTNEHDPYFEPVVHLPVVTIKTNEEDETEMVKLRCKLYRYFTSNNTPEWKERGTGDIKLLKNEERKSVRILMRQDKTLKIRANHYITPYMELKPSCGSDRAWVWSVPADFADEEPKQECFAARFANSANATLFKENFDDARGFITVGIIKSQSDLNIKEDDTDGKETNSDTGDTTKEDEEEIEIQKEIEKLTVNDKHEA